MTHPAPERSHTPFRPALSAFGTWSVIDVGRRDRALLALAASVAVLVPVAVAAAVGRSPSGPWAGALLGVLVTLVAYAAVDQVRAAKSTRALTRTLELLADGDATARLSGRPARAHAALAIAVERLAIRLDGALQEFGRAAAAFDAGWREVKDISISMSDNAETTAGRAADAAVAAEQVSAAVQMVASAAQELVASFQDVSVHASRVAKVASEAANSVSEATVTAQELTAASARAEDVLGLINAMARQTHLLALNARIEAARAGVHGAGFTAIADEVKHLASVTANATGEVGDTVRSIQAGTVRVTGGMRDLDQTIASVSASQGAIAAAVEEQTITTRSIGQSVTEAADRATSIAESIASFAKEAGLTAYAGTQTRAAAGNLAVATVALRGVLDSFSVTASADEALTEAAYKVATVENGVTVISSEVMGDGLHQFDYRGLWSHDAGSEVTDANSYSSVVDDSVVLRFTGTSLRLFGIKDAHHGLLGVTVDGAAEVAVDTYAPERHVSVPVWHVENLAPGLHELVVRVTGARNTASRFHWGAVTSAEVR